jgi:iron-only hydrogenase group A
MLIDLVIDGQKVSVNPEVTILEAARLSGKKIPTLCYVEGIHTIGACRVCLVDVEGAKTLVPACVTPATDGMKVHTNTRRVRDARRIVVELLLSEHDGNCQTCERSEDCELQTLARDLGIQDIRYPGEQRPKREDTSTAALVCNTSKCILCRRCVSVCTEIQDVGAICPQNRGFETIIGPALGSDLKNTICVQCGQCAAVCPVSAIKEKDNIEKVWFALDNPDKHVIVQTAPAIRAALGECFGYPPGTLVTGKMTSALRRVGFDAVFDTEFAADLTIMEEGVELLNRLTKVLAEKEDISLPQFSSCCPAWIKFAEHFYPDFLPNISTCKSPQQMFGAVAKTYYARKISKRPEDIFVVSIMPCTAKKFEAERPEMADSGVQDIDAVLTTRELGRLIKQAGIEFNSLPDGEMDAPFGISSGAADIFANTGGVMEAALRTTYEIVTGEQLPFKNLHVESIAGLDGIKEASITFDKTLPEWRFLKGVTLKVAVTHGLANARKIMERIKEGDNPYHFIEIMACPGGCIGGGGQPRMTTDEVRRARILAIYNEDKGKKLRKSHENPALKQLYEEFMGEPLGEKSHHLLHTHYAKRKYI